MISLDDEAGLQLTIPDEMVAFALTAGEARSVLALFLGVPHRALRPPSRGVRLASDHAALRPGDDGATIADLGLGRRASSFAVRTRDPEIVAALRAVEGMGWPAALDEVGELLKARSPERVVSSPAGRIEVYTPIPPPDGASPEGSHTHLQPGTIELGRDLPSPLRRCRRASLPSRRSTLSRAGRGDGVRQLLLIGIGARYEAAVLTSATTFFSTAGVHSVSAYDVGHIGPSSRIAASSKPSVA